MNAANRSETGADARVFHLKGNERYLAGWYWVKLDTLGNQHGELEGPFDNAVAAGADAREWLIARKEAESSSDTGASR